MRSSVRSFAEVAIRPDDAGADVASLEAAKSLQSIRAALAGRLRARRAEIEETVFARFRETGFDPAAGEDVDYVAGSRAAIAEAVDFGLVGIERGESWSGSLQPATAAQMRRAARAGVSLQKVLARYNIGRAVLEDFVVQEAEQGDLASQRIALRHLLATLGVLLDHLTSAGLEEYQRELQRMAHSTELRLVERVQRLLAGGHVDSAELGYQLDAWHLGVIATGARARQTVRSLAGGLGRELLSMPRGEQTVWAWLGGQRRLASSDVERLLSAREAAGVWLAIGEPRQGVEGWRLTNRQARAAMLVAVRRPPTSLTRFADIALLAAVLRDEGLARSLVQIHLSPLEDQRDGGAASRETLRAYFAAGCNGATAAAALGVARHTVERRLRAIEEMLDRPLRTCHAELEVALLLEELGDATRSSGRSRSTAQ
ncbi:MAG TPA: helix-turn-helix domain-containing protein [Solirubrobacteraceae bacterium]|nr:helix-turn-helix domain-containing protein [Solirubrobacteraceae bacterium]